jgi:hypothetical protein
VAQFSVSANSYIPPAEAEANYWRQNAPVASTTKLAQAAVQQEG